MWSYAIQFYLQCNFNKTQSIYLSNLWAYKRTSCYSDLISHVTHNCKVNYFGFALLNNWSQKKNGATPSTNQMQVTKPIVTWSPAFSSALDSLLFFFIDWMRYFLLSNWLLGLLWFWFSDNRSKKRCTTSVLSGRVPQAKAQALL